jgi:uncharacterized protein
MPVHQLTRDRAARIALRAQLLTAERPADLLETLRRLTLLQVQPAYTMVPSADLVLWSRIGAGYRPEQLADALEVERSVFELNGVVRAMSDIDLFRPAFATALEGTRAERWIDDNAEFRDDVLALLETDGPVLAREVPDTSVVPWESSGWTKNKNVQQLLELLQVRGEIAVSRRDAGGRWWDLAERIYPPAREELTVAEAERRLNDRRLASFGLVPVRSSGSPIDPVKLAAHGEPAEVEGVRGQWRVDPAYLVDDGFEGRAALLSPFDRLIYDRRRTHELFGYEYLLEMYKPAVKRRWGYFALPILFRDRLVGKLDATVDAAAGVLLVDAVHEDEPFDRATRDAVDAEIAALAAWRGLHLLRGADL